MDLLKLVDNADFRSLFVDELGWSNPDVGDRTLHIENGDYRLTQVATYKGLRIWFCNTLPPRRVQRTIDTLLARDNFERLIIFADKNSQEWRWPRKRQTEAVNAKLLAHSHVPGTPNRHLEQQLEAIRVDFDDEPTLIELLARMRTAFDSEAESASIAAARLMGSLYSELEKTDVATREATLLLARVLFLLFGDDSEMWEANVFHDFLRDHTDEDSLVADLLHLFKVLDTPSHLRSEALESPYSKFRYINGGLFEEQLTIDALTPEFRSLLLTACDFDWSVISPAVFGSMFQTVKDKEARRYGGEHYTTEENILRTIGPLFLTELGERLTAAWDDKAQLTRLHNDLGRMRFLDPACGCGNFLIVAYRELRALELELLKRRRDLDIVSGTSSGGDRSQLSFDVTATIQVKLDHFFGIEIEEWPARIAETAMLLVDHLANQRMEQEFGVAPDRLPIELAPTIVHDNALHVDWTSVVTPSPDVYILGNPPFIGQYTKTADQTADAKAIWGERYNGYLDYVTCWYAKAIDYYGQVDGRWAFVSTNSICQGEAVEFLWRPILEAGWRCRFAHRSLRWETETPGGAAVHVSIIGFDRERLPRPVLWTYPDGGRGDAHEVECAKAINPYLVPDARIVLIGSSTNPRTSSLSPVDYGNKPTDGGHLSVRPQEYPEVHSDPIAAKYLRRFVGARELLHNKVRHCLWLTDATPSELRISPVLSTRVELVRGMRLASTKAATRRKAETSHLFDERRQPTTSYLAIPRHFGENRQYFAAARLEPEVICGDANFMVADPDGFILGVLSSSMFISWMRAIGGRIKSDLRFSNTFVYNTFPLPKVPAVSRLEVTSAAAEIARVRSGTPDKSLADLYESDALRGDLLAAHVAVDQAIDKLFGFEGGNEVERQRHLFDRYARMTASP